MRTRTKQKECVSTQEAARTLSVTAATINNLVMVGVLSSSTKVKGRVDRESVLFCKDNRINLVMLRTEEPDIGDCLTVEETANMMHITRDQVLSSAYNGVLSSSLFWRQKRVNGTMVPVFHRLTLEKIKAEVLSLQKKTLYTPAEIFNSIMLSEKARRAGVSYSAMYMRKQKGHVDTFKIMSGVYVLPEEKDTAKSILQKKPLREEVKKVVNSRSGAVKKVPAESMKRPSRGGTYKATSNVPRVPIVETGSALLDGTGYMTLEKAHLLLGKTKNSSYLYKWAKRGYVTIIKQTGGGAALIHVSEFEAFLSAMTPPVASIDELKTLSKSVKASLRFIVTKGKIVVKKTLTPTPPVSFRSSFKELGDRIASFTPATPEEELQSDLLKTIVDWADRHIV